MNKESCPFYEFGPYRLEPAERLLQCNGKTIPLTPKAFDTLLVLAENSGRLLEREKLMQQLWPDSFVEEANLAHNISLLRKVFAENTPGEHYIETVPKRGYRFLVKVVCEGDKAPDKVVGPLPSSIATEKHVREIPKDVCLAPCSAVSGHPNLLRGLSIWIRMSSQPPPMTKEPRLIAVLPFCSGGNGAW